MTEKFVYSQIVNLIAFHKKELLSNIEKLGYRLPDNKDETVVSFITANAGSREAVAQMLGEMIAKYDGKQITGEVFSNGVLDAIGDIVGGVTGVFKEKEANKGKQIEANSAIMTQLMAVQAAREAQANKGLSTGAIIGIVAGSLLIVGAVLFLTLRKPKVQPTQTKPIKS